MQNKYLYFIFICLTLRIIIPIILLKLNKKYLKLAGLILLLPSIGFLILYFTNLRIKGVFSKVWWENMRLLHGILYLSSAIYCLQGKAQYASIALFIDVILGLLNWINNYFL